MKLLAIGEILWDVFDASEILARTLTFANALGALVASRSGATPPWTAAECWRLIDENRLVEAQSFPEPSASIL